MVRHHVRSFGNNKIMAIKLVRELTGLGLKEAKDLVESHSGFFASASAAVQAQVAEDAHRYGIEFDPPLDGTVAIIEQIEQQQGDCSVRFVSGTKIIHAIKLVRELTGLGLKEAKDVVDQQLVFRTGLSLAYAEDISRRFAEIDGQVQILGGATLPPPRTQSYAYQDEDDDDF